MADTLAHSVRPGKSICSLARDNFYEVFTNQQVMQHRQNLEKVRFTICFRRDSNERPVVFKSDGQRFLQPHTVKFNQDETYAVQVSFEPQLPIESFLLHEEKIALEEVIHNSGANTQVAYHGKWKPQSFERTPRNQREQLKITVHLQNHGIFLATLQSKFYPVEEVTHSSWGESLNALLFECQIGANKTITVQRQYIL